MLVKVCVGTMEHAVQLGMIIYQPMEPRNIGHNRAANQNGLLKNDSIPGRRGRRVEH